MESQSEQTDHETSDISTSNPSNTAPNEKQTTIHVTSTTKFTPTREFHLAFFSLCTITAAVAFEATSLSVALPLISTELGGTALEAFWSGTGYLLSSTVLNPSVASLSGIFGRKYVIYVTGVLFAAGSLIGGLAKNFAVILVGRTIQGAGGGGLMALGEIVVTDLIPLAHRGQWLSIFSAIWAIGTVSGPLIGAGFAQNVSWRWIFYINLPITGVGLGFVAVFLNQRKIPGKITQKLRRFDYVGSFLFTGSMTSFLYGLTTGGVIYEWSSYEVLLPLLIGLVGTAVFLVYEFKYATEPIIDRGLFRNWSMIASYVMTVFHGAILWSIIYFLLLYYQGVKFYTPVNSAVAGLPESLTVTPAAVVVGVVAGKTGRYRWALWGGWLLATLGAGLLLLLKPETTVVQWIFLNIPLGLGTGMLFPAMGLSIQAACDPALNAEAIALYSFMSGLGQAIGVAVSGVIFQNALKQKLGKIPAFAAVSEHYSRDATILVGIINQMPDGRDKTDLVRAYCDSLHMIWVALSGFSAASLVLSGTVQEYSLSQEHVTQQGLVGREGTGEKEGIEGGMVGSEDGQVNLTSDIV